MKSQELQETMNTSPKKLNFTAPFLSTKRPKDMHQAYSNCASETANHRVPFSWEQTPGKPKELHRGVTIDENTLLSPKPPPGRRTYPKESTTGHDDFDEEGTSYESSHGDDVLSLSEAMDIVDKENKVHQENIIGQHGLNSLMVESLGNQSPDFMIRRFLPDANAVAFPKGYDTEFPNYLTNLPDDFYDEPQTGIGETNYSSSTMGCGMFPWRARVKPCSIKSPVQKCMADSKPRLSTGRKQSSAFAQLRE